MKSKTYTQNKQPLDKTQSSKFCQLGVKRTRFQNQKGYHFKLSQDLIAGGKALNKEAVQSWKVCDVHPLLYYFPPVLFTLQKSARIKSSDFLMCYVLNNKPLQVQISQGRVVWGHKYFVTFIACLMTRRGASSLHLLTY